MNADAVARYQKDALTGHRPTWKMGANTSAKKGKGSAEADLEGASDPFSMFSELNGRGRWRPGPGGAAGETKVETRKMFNAERKALQVMGLGADATLETVKAKYKALVKQHHPDANGGDRSTEDRLIEIIKAYNYLKTVVREELVPRGGAPASSMHASSHSAVHASRHRADIGRTRPDQPAAPLLLAGVRGPSGGAGHREDRRKGLPRNFKRVEQDRGEELHIGIERTVRIFPPQRLADIGLDFARERKIGAAAGEPLDRAFQHVRARIADPIERWPKPISRSPRASALSTHGLMRSRLPMASSISSTGSGAPPCSGPVSAQYPAVTDANRSACVEATTRVVKVDAFMP